MNNSKTKVDDLDAGKLKTVPVDVKKLSDVVDNEVAKNTKINTLNTKSNSFKTKYFWCNYFTLHKPMQHR